jgi:UDP-N-acetylglucosamine 2-epimerase (non-hydrolysing)
LNPRVRETVYRILRGHERIILINPLSYETFVHLMRAADLILTDSGGIQEEAPILGKPVLVMRQETERPEGVAVGIVKIIGTEADRLVFETERLLHDPEEYRRMALAVNLYGDGHAADRIVQIVLERFQVQ